MSILTLTLNDLIQGCIKNFEDKTQFLILRDYLEEQGLPHKDWVDCYLKGLEYNYHDWNHAAVWCKNKQPRKTRLISCIIFERMNIVYMDLAPYIMLNLGLYKHTEIADNSLEAKLLKTGDYKQWNRYWYNKGHYYSKFLLTDRYLSTTNLSKLKSIKCY